MKNNEKITFEDIKNLVRNFERYFNSLESNDDLPLRIIKAIFKIYCKYMRRQEEDIDIVNNHPDVLRTEVIKLYTGKEVTKELISDYRKYKHKVNEILKKMITKEEGGQSLNPKSLILKSGVGKKGEKANYFLQAKSMNMNKAREPSMPKKFKLDPHEDLDRRSNYPTFKEQMGALEHFAQAAFYPEHFEHLKLEDDASLLDYVEEAGGLEKYTALLTRSLPSETEKKEIRILELACGKAPFLARLFFDHEKNKRYGNPCSHFRRIIDYIGVDKKVSSSVMKEHLYRLNNERSKNNSCFPEVTFKNYDLSNIDQLEALNSESGQWDLIVLSNALHEFPIKSWPVLLAFIPEMLRAKGRFALVDLDDAKRFESGLWIRDLETFRERFWETNAIWISNNEARSLIEKAELQVSFGTEEGEWWLVESTKPENLKKSRSDREQDIQKEIHKILSDKRNDGHTKLFEERQETRCSIVKSHEPFIKIVKALRYLCICATNCYGDESLNHLNKVNVK